MPSPRRIEKLEILLREEIAAGIDRAIEFSAGTLVTITRVAVSPDGRYATVYFSALGGSRANALAVLQKNAYHLQQEINRALRMRPVPKIRFAHDEGEEKRERVEESLAALKRKSDL